MSEIEDEIRRQLLEEREQARQSQTFPGSDPTPPQPPASLPPNGNFLPPPALPPVPPYNAAPPPHYPPHYPPQYPPQSTPPPSGPPPAAPQSPNRKGLLGGMGAIGVALAKFWGAIKALLVGLKFLTFGKFFLTAGSMLITVFLYSFAFGWPFAIGFVLLLLIHESGHAFATKRLGHTVNAMVFIPFMGAFVSRSQTRNITEAAHIAIMGPVAGTLGALFCAIVYSITGSSFWLALAWIGFFLNLLNLAPSPILDGGRIAMLFSPKLLLPGLIISLFFFWRNPMFWMFTLMGLPQIMTYWKGYPDMEYFKVQKQDRWTYGLAYAGLAVFLGVACWTTQTWLHEIVQLHRRF